MEKGIIIITIGILFILVIGLLVRLLQYKKQVKSFAIRTRERKETGMNQPVSVDIFDKDMLELANALNEYTQQQKEISAQLERDRERLQYVIAGISHDFRTPLTASIGYMQMVKKNGQMGEPDREYLDIALDKTLYLKNLSDEFFELSSVEAATEDVETKPVSITKMLEESILGQYDWMEERRLKTRFEIPSKGVYVLGNEHYLKRILENLFSNMEKYSESYISVELMIEEKQVRLVVENDLPTGEELDCTRIFEPFYRTPSRHKKGSGLGLYVVKCLADKLGYELDARCQDGRFWVEVSMRICK